MRLLSSQYLQSLPKTSDNPICQATSRIDSPLGGTTPCFSCKPWQTPVLLVIANPLSLGISRDGSPARPRLALHDWLLRAHRTGHWRHQAQHLQLRRGPDTGLLLGASATLLGTSASLLVTSALLVVTMFAIRNKCLTTRSECHATRNKCIASSNKCLTSSNNVCY